MHCLLSQWKADVTVGLGASQAPTSLSWLRQQGCQVEVQPVLQVCANQVGSDGCRIPMTFGVQQ